MTAPPAQLQSPARAPTLDPSVEDLLELLASITGDPRKPPVLVPARARPANHPTEKPIALVRQWIAQFTDVGDLILDPFMGSGTVLRAAKDLGRQAIGIEIERRWCEHAATRLAQSVMPGFDATAAAVEGGPELAMGAGGVPPELFPLMRAGIDLNTGVRS